jgi:acyl carrier protein
LAEIWRTVLNMDRIGVEDSYHDLGGDSLLAALMFDLIQKAFLTKVPMSILAKAPTIADLAWNIDRTIAP